MRIDKDAASPDSRRSSFEKEFLALIEPSHTQEGAPYYPVSLVLRDETIVTKAVVMRKKYAFREFNIEHHAGRMVSPSDVSRVESSRFRLPWNIVDRINAVGETAMGSIAFIAETADGNAFSFWGTSPLPGDIDFLELPHGFSPNEVVSVEFVRPPPEPSFPAALPPERGSIALCLL